jgi:hypothetical protein
MAEGPIDSNLLGLTARIVSAHVANNPTESVGLWPFGPVAYSRGRPSLAITLSSLD